MQLPIDTLPLFPVLDNRLISFLKELPAADWQKQTVARQWVVKDVAAHLLDVNFRKISSGRDHWQITPGTPIQSNEDLVNYLNGLNSDWVKAAKRLSPGVLIELLEWTSPIVYELFTRLDPFAASAYPVSWAGETMSYNWFDIAREYTERWHHQQQIRDAVGNRDILTKELYKPVLHIFLQAWPFTARKEFARAGTILRTLIAGEGGGEWYLVRTTDEWKLTDRPEGEIAAETIIDGDTAWKLFSKSVRKEDIPGKFEINGDRQLGEIVLNMVSVMA